MSLYDLAVTSGQSDQPLVIIKHSAVAADDDPQNTVIYGGQKTSSVVVSPYSVSAFDDAGAIPPPTVEVKTQPIDVKAALSKLTNFIPTESITIYLGAVSAVAAIAEANKGTAAAVATNAAANDEWITKLFTPILLYWLTALVITPLIFLLIRAIVQLKQSKKPFAEFPIWKLSAAVIAFLIWALAIPGNPYAGTAAAKAGFAFLAIIVSILLDLVDQFYEASKLKSAVT